MSQNQTSPALTMLEESGLSVGDRVEYTTGPYVWAGRLAQPTRCNHHTVLVDTLKQGDQVTRYGRESAHEVWLGDLRPATF